MTEFNKQALRAALEAVIADLDYDMYKSLLDGGESEYDFEYVVDNFINEYEDADTE